MLRESQMKSQVSKFWVNATTVHVALIAKVECNNLLTPVFPKFCKGKLILPPTVPGQDFPRSANMVHRTSQRALPAALALAFCFALTSQVCFFNPLSRVLGGGRKDAIRVRAKGDEADTKKPQMSPAKAAPSSAPSPQAASTAPETPPAKGAPPAPAEAKSLDAMEALEASRDKMSVELKEIAKGMGILTNVTRSDLKLFGLIKEKAKRRRRDRRQEYTPEQWAEWRSAGQSRQPTETVTPAARPSAAPDAGGAPSGGASAPAESKAAAIAADKRAKGNGPVELKDLEQRLVRAELALMLEEPSQEKANFELVVEASQKVR
eukprot:s325_g33.t1